MMNRILFVILAVILIIGMSTTGCGGGSCVKELAGIRGIDIWADESLPPQYLLHLVTVQFDGCHEFDSYNMMRADNTTIIVDVFNLDCPNGCPDAEFYFEVTIPLGSDFVPGVNYTIDVNDVTVTFVVDGITIYPAPIRKVLIRNDELSPPEYFVDVEWGEPCVCDHLDSIEVTRTGNKTVIVEILNRRSCTGYPGEYSSNWKIISIGNDFVPGINYTVEVNDVIKTFTAEA